MLQKFETLWDPKGPENTVTQITQSQAIDLISTVSRFGVLCGYCQDPIFGIGGSLKQSVVLLEPSSVHPITRLALRVPLTDSTYFVRSRVGPVLVQLERHGSSSDYVENSNRRQLPVDSTVTVYHLKRVKGLFDIIYVAVGKASGVTLGDLI